MPQTKEDMSPTYAYLHTNTMVNKNGAIHLGMLPFITPFEVVNETIDGKIVTSLQKIPTHEFMSARKKSEFFRGC